MSALGTPPRRTARADTIRPQPEREGDVKVKVEGRWPGEVTLRRGWAWAESRPWNAELPLARLEIERGGPAFLGDCADALASLGADGVLSPPLPRAVQPFWERADFLQHARLRVLRRELTPVPSPEHPVDVGTPGDLDAALRIDAAAFDEFWRFDRRAMSEAIEATPYSVIHVVKAGEGTPAGFAITGMGSAIAFLQRVAVAPQWQGRGMGRSLVRAAARWARRAGAPALVLNTQADNEAGYALYTGEGFREVGSGLVVLRK